MVSVRECPGVELQPGDPLEDAKMEDGNSYCMSMTRVVLVSLSYTLSTLAA